MLLGKKLGYSESVKVLGTIVEYSQLKQTATLLKGNSAIEVDANDLVVMEYIGKMNETEIFEGDVFNYVGNKQTNLRIRLDGDRVILEVLNKKMKPVNEYANFEKAHLPRYGNRLSMVGNYYEMLNELPSLDFNIKIVKCVDSGHYYYAGNNIEDETVDMIKVIYIGSHLLQEEAYFRTTIDWENYMKLIEEGSYIEVTPFELQKYVMSGGMPVKEEKKPVMYAPAQEERICGVSCDCAEDEDCAESYETEAEIEYCQGCGEDEDDCECPVDEDPFN